MGKVAFIVKKKFSEKVDEINELLIKFDEHINKIDEINGDKMTPQLEKQRNHLINNKFLMLDLGSAGNRNIFKSPGYKA